MFEAQLLIAKDSEYYLYSPWFPRGGDNARFTVDVVAVSAGSLTIRAFTKSAEDEGPGTDAHAATTIIKAAVGRESNYWDGTFKDLVRYKYAISGAEAGDWILFRMLTPQWNDSVAV